MEVRPFDFLVVGAGMAGLTAGVRAAELGLRVAVLEQGTSDTYLCNTRVSGGIFHVSYSDIGRSPNDLRAIIDRATYGEAEPELVSALANDARKLVDWLRSQGIAFIRGGAAEWCTWMLAPPRRLAGGLDWRGRGPDGLLLHLARRLQTYGGELILGAHARALRMDGGRCAGLEADIGGDAQYFVSEAVLLADGGFQANVAMIGEHISSAPAALMQRGGATSRGDALRMAVDAGAAVTRLDRFYGRLLSRDAFKNELLWPFPELDALGSAGIMVGPNGRRIADEGRSGIFLANAVAKLADPLSATLIFDLDTWEGPGRSARTPANPNVSLAGGTLYQASSLEGLAEVASLDVDGLCATVSHYNAAIAANATETLDPPRSTDRYAALPIRRPPYFAMPVCAGITYTMGGIRIDAHGRVVARSGGIVEGLYAAGSCTGGLEGGEHVGYTGGLVRAGVFALRAAEAAAGAQRPDARQGLHDTGPTQDRSEAMMSINSYPFLRLIVGYGKLGALILAVTTVVILFVLTQATIGWLAIPASLLPGTILYIVCASYTELVTLTADMLLPRR